MFSQVWELRATGISVEILLRPPQSHADPFDQVLIMKASFAPED